MSVFLNAITRINEINIDEQAKPSFVASMRAFHNYFTKHNLFNTFDIDEYFEKHLFNANHKGETKLKIKFYDSREDFEKNIKSDDPTLVEASYNPTKNLINLTPPILTNKDRLQNTTEEQVLLKNFTHEFVHFLTLNRTITLQDEPSKRVYSNNEYLDILDKIYKKLETPEGRTKEGRENIQNQYAKYYFSHYYDKPFLYEPLTEMLTVEVLNDFSNPAYVDMYNLVKFLHISQDIDFPRDFLKRNLLNYKKSLSFMSLEKVYGQLQELYNYDYKNSDYTPEGDKNYEKVFKELVVDMANEYTLKIHEKASTIEPNEFLLLQSKLYNSIPQKYFLKLERVLQNANEIYAIQLLKDNNIAQTEQNIEVLCDKIKKYLDYSEVAPSKDNKLNDFVKVVTPDFCFIVKPNDMGITIQDLNIVNLNQNNALPVMNVPNYLKEVKNPEHNEALQLLSAKENCFIVFGKTKDGALTVSTENDTVKIKYDGDVLNVTINDELIGSAKDGKIVQDLSTLEEDFIEEISNTLSAMQSKQRLQNNNSQHQTFNNSERELR